MNHYTVTGPDIPDDDWYYQAAVGTPGEILDGYRTGPDGPRGYYDPVNYHNRDTGAPQYPDAHAAAKAWIAQEARERGADPDTLVAVVWRTTLVGVPNVVGSRRSGMPYAHMMPMALRAWQLVGTPFYPDNPEVSARLRQWFLKQMAAAEAARVSRDIARDIPDELLATFLAPAP